MGRRHAAQSVLPRLLRLSLSLRGGRIRTIRSVRAVWSGSAVPVLQSVKYEVLHMARLVDGYVEGVAEVNGVGGPELIRATEIGERDAVLERDTSERVGGLDLRLRVSMLSICLELGVELVES